MPAWTRGGGGRSIARGMELSYKRASADPVAAVVLWWITTEQPLPYVHFAAAAATQAQLVTR
jgi:hypothetical protein